MEKDSLAFLNRSRNRSSYSLKTSEPVQLALELVGAGAVLLGLLEELFDALLVFGRGPFVFVRFLAGASSSSAVSPVLDRLLHLHQQFAELLLHVPWLARRAR